MICRRHRKHERPIANGATAKRSASARSGSSIFHSPTIHHTNIALTLLRGVHI